LQHQLVAKHGIGSSCSAASKGCEVASVDAVVVVVVVVSTAFV
jgi:hypothetical protein